MITGQTIKRGQKKKRRGQVKKKRANKKKEESK